MGLGCSFFLYCVLHARHCEWHSRTNNGQFCEFKLDFDVWSPILEYHRGSKPNYVLTALT